MARLYAGETFPFPVAEELRWLGHDVLTVAETGRSNQRMSDAEVLEFAIAESRAVLTHNRKHFFALHRQRPAHAGIVACTYDADFNALAVRIHAVTTDAATLDGQFIRVIRPAV